MDDQDIVNAIYVQKSTAGAITGQNVFDLANSTASVFIQDLLPAIGAQYFLNRVVATDLTTPDGSQTIVSASAGLSGAITAGSPVPNNVAFCVTLSTGLAGRSHRGRLYIGGIRTGMMTGVNTMINSSANLIVNGVAALVANASDETGGDFRTVIVSRYSNNQLRPVGVAVPVAGVGQRDLTVDSQRRRLPGRGT